MVGAGITGLFGGGSSQPAAAEAAPAQPQAQAQSNSWGDRSNVSCEADAKSFTKCMDDYKGDMSICGWYLDQLVSHYCPLGYCRDYPSQVSYANGIPHEI